jgi:SAM-dependent methyltransferase
VPDGCWLTLTDLSQGMVDEAFTRIEAAERFASVSAKVADAQALPFETDAFDIVVANHMLYHLPSPERGVAELARVVKPAGRVIVATNGRRHMRELWDVRQPIFGGPLVDQTVDVFGVETGFPILRDHFSDVAWHAYPDELRCTDPDDVIAYVCSTPPAEDATPQQRAEVEAAIRRRFEEAGGAMTITKDTGAFVCSNGVSGRG